MKPTKNNAKELSVFPSDRTPVHMTELVLPSHTNAHGTIFGGVVMGWIDIAGAIACQKYARSGVVTVSIDSLHFIVPIKIGFTVHIYAEVTYAGKTSMETEVTVKAENGMTGESRVATHAFLTYVAVDEFGRPKAVPPYKPRNEREKQNFSAALQRKDARLKARS